MNDRVQRFQQPGREDRHPGTEQSRRTAVLLAVVQFDESAALVGLLRAHGLGVEVFDSLPAAVATLRLRHSAVLVVRVRPEDGDVPLTFVIRNFETRAADDDLFHDRFAQFFAGPVDPQTLYAAVVRSALASDDPLSARRGAICRSA